MCTTKAANRHSYQVNELKSWWQHPMVYWSVIVWIDLAILFVLEHGRFIRFAIAGGTTVPVGLGVLWLGVDVLGVHYVLSNLVAIGASTAVWFVLQSKWTFGDRQTDRTSAWTGPMIRLGAIGLHTAFLVFFTEVCGLWYMLSSVMAMCIEMPICYLLSNRIAWARRRAKGPRPSV